MRVNRSEEKNMNKHIVLLVLDVLYAYLSVKKFYCRSLLLPCDIKFLKDCRSHNFIPRFLWFITANQQLSSSTAYRKSQFRLLKVEIREKYRYLHKIKKLYESSLDVLRDCVSNQLFYHLLDVIAAEFTPILKKKMETLQRKFDGYTPSNQYTIPGNEKVVTNLSNYRRSKEEYDWPTT